MSKPWHVRERDLTWLEEFRAEWLPPELGKRVRTVVRRSNEVGIEVEGWVGSVSLLNGDLLHIGSKFGEADFMRILFRAQGVADYALNSTEYGLSTSRSPLRYVLPNFLRSLRKIHSQGLMFDWRRRAVVSRTRPAYVDVPETARRMYAGKRDSFAGHALWRSRDVPEHRVLSLAASFVLADVEAEMITADDRNLLGSWRQRQLFPRSIQRDLAHVQTGLVRRKYYGSRGYYAPALREAMVILGLNGLTTLAESDLEGAGFLTNSDILFEKYIRAILLDSYSSNGLTFIKEEPNASYLFVDGTASLEPDILVRRGSSVLAVGDIKHKSPGSGDYYQMFTYLRHYGVKRGFLLCASDTTAQTNKTLLTRRDENEIVMVFLPISDLDELEKSVAELGTIVGF